MVGGLSARGPLMPSIAWPVPDIRRIRAGPHPSASPACIGRPSCCCSWFPRPARGVSAFLIAHSCCQLPVGLTAKPLSSAQLPRLAACFHDERFAEFRAIYAAACGWRCSWLCRPVWSWPRRRRRWHAPSRRDHGNRGWDRPGRPVHRRHGDRRLGETMVAVTTSASYARQDARSPVHAMALRLLVAGLAAMIAHTHSPAPSACSWSGRRWPPPTWRRACPHWTQRRGLPETPGKRRNDLPPISQPRSSPSWSRRSLPSGWAAPPALRCATWPWPRRH